MEKNLETLVAALYVKIDDDRRRREGCGAPGTGADDRRQGLGELLGAALKECSFGVEVLGGVLERKPGS